MNKLKSIIVEGKGLYHAIWSIMMSETSPYMKPVNQMVIMAGLTDRKSGMLTWGKPGSSAWYAKLTPANIQRDGVAHAGRLSIAIREDNPNAAAIQSKMHKSFGTWRSGDLGKGYTEQTVIINTDSVIRAADLINSLATIMKESKMLKLKTILSEGYAWEREAGKPLPTLADTTAAYARKLREEAELNMPEDEVDESAKPDYIDADGDGNEKESMKKAFADKEDSDFSEYSDSALRDMKVNLSRYDGNEEEIAQINRELDKRKKNESALITKAGLQEMREIPLEDRILRNLRGNDYILRETFKK